MEGRRRLSRGSVEVQTSQWQPMVRRPTLVPEPRTVIFSGDSGIRRSGLRLRGLVRGCLVRNFFGTLGGLVRRLDEPEAELGERIHQQAQLFERKVALGLFQKNGQDVDG